MIEKNKFREKLISPHVSSADVKVILYLLSLQYVLESGQYSKRRNKMDKLTPYQQLIHKLKFISQNTK
jgi:hypothetical protein